MHWNGRSWQIQASFSPGSNDNLLFGVTALSRTSAWTAGEYGFPAGASTLVENWNSGMWQVQSTASPGTLNLLTAISARTGSDVWAVGGQSPTANNFQTLILHWNGGTWAIMPSPDVSPTQNVLESVAIESASDALAVGYEGTKPRPLIEHWNGTSWKVQASPS